MRWVVGTFLTAVCCGFGATGWFIWKLPHDSLLIHAVSSSLYEKPINSVTQLAAKLRVRFLPECPTTGIRPNTTIGYLAAAHDHPGSIPAEVEEIIELLIRNGCDINQYSESGTTPLHDAVLFNNAQLVSLLLNLNANPHLEIKQSPHNPEKRKKILGLNALEFAHYLNENSGQAPGGWSEVISILSEQTNGT